MVPLIARRRASVGCAVSTGRNSSSPSLRSASSRPTSSVSLANAAGMVSSRTAGPVVVSASRERRRAHPALCLAGLRGHCASRDVRQQLAAEAQAEQRQSGVQRLRGQPPLARQERVVQVVVRHEAAAQQDHAREPVEILGKLGARSQDGFEAGFGKPLFEPAHQAGGRVQDNQDTRHASTLGDISSRAK